jgi:hypothetical protein
MATTKYWELASLARAILCNSPGIAEVNWAFIKPRPNIPKEHWIQIRNAHYGGWVIYHMDGSYQALPRRPDGVKVSEIIIVEDPPEAFFSLRRRLGELLDEAHDTGLKAKFAPVISLIAELDSGAFEAREVSGFLAGCITPFESMGGGPAALAAVKLFLTEYMTSLQPRLESFQLPGYYLGLMRLLNFCWRDVIPECLIGLHFHWRSIRSMSDLLGNLFQPMVENEGPKLVEQAAKSLMDDGMRLVDEARNIEMYNDFYGKLFVSCSSFLGAQSGYNYLAESGGLSAEHRAGYATAAQACGRELAIPFRSVMIAFQNSISANQPFHDQQAYVGQVYRELGEGSAKKLVDRYVSRELLYPKSFLSAFLKN